MAISAPDFRPDLTSICQSLAGHLALCLLILMPSVLLAFNNSKVGQARAKEPTPAAGDSLASKAVVDSLRREVRKLEREVGAMKKAMHPPIAGRPAADSTPPAEPGSGSLSVTSLPPFAEVMIDGRFAGTTPHKRSLRAGRHKITVVHRNFPPFDTTVHLAADEDLTLRFRLFRDDGSEPSVSASTRIVPTATASPSEPSETVDKKSSAMILVKSTPPFAQLSINGKPRGETPMNAPLEVPAGRVRIEVVERLSGMFDTTLNISAGQRLGVKIDIKSGKVLELYPY